MRAKLTPGVDAYDKNGDLKEPWRWGFRGPSNKSTVRINGVQVEVRRSVNTRTGNQVNSGSVEYRGYEITVRHESGCEKVQVFLDRGDRTVYAMVYPEDLDAFIQENAV